MWEDRERNNANANVKLCCSQSDINAKLNHADKGTEQYSGLIREPQGNQLDSQLNARTHARTQMLSFSLPLHSLTAVCLPPLSMKISFLLCVQYIIRCLRPIFGAEEMLTSSYEPFFIGPFTVKSRFKHTLTLELRRDSD